MMTETFHMASNSHLSVSIVILLKTELKWITFLQVYVKLSAINNDTPPPGLLYVNRIHVCNLLYNNCLHCVASISFLLLQ